MDPQKTIAINAAAQTWTNEIEGIMKAPEDVTLTMLATYAVKKNMSIAEYVVRGVRMLQDEKTALAFYAKITTLTIKAIQ